MRCDQLVRVLRIAVAYKHGFRVHVFKFSTSIFIISVVLLAVHALSALL